MRLTQIRHVCRPLPEQGSNYLHLPAALSSPPPSTASRRSKQSSVAKTWPFHNPTQLADTEVMRASATTRSPSRRQAALIGRHLLGPLPVKHLPIFDKARNPSAAKRLASGQAGWSLAPRHQRPRPCWVSSRAASHHPPFSPPLPRPSFPSPVSRPRLSLPRSWSAGPVHSELDFELRLSPLGLCFFPTLAVPDSTLEAHGETRA